MSILIPTWVDGVLTPVEKLEAHQRGLRHKAVSVFVTRGDEILLQQRALEKYHTPGLWANTCCTHPEWDEPSDICAIRRLDEELGIKGLAPVFRQTVEYRADVGGGLIEHEVVDIFVANVDRSIDLNPNPSEVMATKWISKRDLDAQIEKTPEIFTPWLKIYMQKHCDAIFDGLDLATA